MRYCKYCYRMIEDGAKFCPACGKAQANDSRELAFDQNNSGSPQAGPQEIPAISCPKCGSTDIKLQLKSAGTTSRTDYYHVGDYYTRGSKTRESQQNYKSVALCQHCGHHWEPDAAEPKKKTGCLIWIFLIVLILLCFKACSNNNTEASTWATSFTPLSEFEYYIDAGEIYLKDYNGDGNNVFIAPSYNVGGKELPVVSLDGVFALNHVNSVIISDGITKISNNTFNSCGIQYLYLPSSLSEFNGWNYFHDVEKLYYGGSESDWANLCQYDRSKLEVVEVICNASIVELFKEE